jgi:hypothetical protein
VVELLPSKHEALSSNPVTPSTQKKKIILFRQKQTIPKISKGDITADIVQNLRP